MGEVLVTYKIMPEGVETDLDSLLSKIKEKINIERVEKEPIAFGLVALKVSVRVEDSGRATEEIEKFLSELTEVGSVEVVEMTRLL